MAYSGQFPQFFGSSYGQTVAHRAEQDYHRTQIAFTPQEADRWGSNATSAAIRATAKTETHGLLAIKGYTEFLQLSWITGAVEYATTMRATLLSGFSSQIFVNLQKDVIQSGIIRKRVHHWVILLSEKSQSETDSDPMSIALFEG